MISTQNDEEPKKLNSGQKDLPSGHNDPCASYCSDVEAYTKNKNAGQIADFDCTTRTILHYRRYHHI